MKKEIKIKWIQGKYGLLVLLFFLILIFSKNSLVHLMLRHYGVQTNGVVIDKTIRETRAGSSTLLYNFKLGDKEYEGNTSKTDPTRNIVGEKIAIIYLPICPTINRPKWLLDEK